MDEVSFRLDDLYNTEADITLPDGQVITVRTMTDAEVNVRELASLEVSSVIEERLSDKGDPEYLSLIAPLEHLDPPDLIAVIMAVKTRYIEDRVRAEFPFRYIPFPDDATDEEKRDVLTRRRESEAKVQQRRSEVQSERGAKERADLEELDHDELRARATNALVSTEMFTARLTEYYAQTIFMACVDEDGSPTFDLEAVRKHGTRGGLNEKVFQRLMSVYNEIDDVDPWILEKHS